MKNKIKHLGIKYLESKEIPVYGVQFAKKDIDLCSAHGAWVIAEKINELISAVNKLIEEKES